MTSFAVDNWIFFWIICIYCRTKGDPYTLRTYLFKFLFRPLKWDSCDFKIVVIMILYAPTTGPRTESILGLLAQFSNAHSSSPRVCSSPAAARRPIPFQPSYGSPLPCSHRQWYPSSPKTTSDWLFRALVCSHSNRPRRELRHAVLYSTVS